MLDYLTCQAKLVACDPVELPAFTGSSLRGALGGALKAVSCVRGASRVCEKQCVAPDRCAYGELMETPVPDDAPRRVRASRFAPHPWVMTPPRGGVLFPGDALEVTLTLFGDARRRIVDVIEALSHWQDMGLGKDRGGLELIALTDAKTGEAIWRGGELSLAAASLETITLEAAPEDDQTDQVELEFESPVQLIRSGDLVREVDLGELVYQCASRLELMASCHGERGPEGVDARAWSRIARDAAVELSRHDLAPIKIERWSSRQKRRHELRGLVGTLELRGELAPFLPLLRAGAVTHIGKGVSFGLGKFSLA